MKMDPFSTHQALVVAAAAHTSGTILEIGGGWYSTPLINALAAGQQRLAITIETAEFVYSLLNAYDGPHHSVRLMVGFPFDEIGRFRRVPPDLDHFKRLQSEFLHALCAERGISPANRVSVAFIDQSPGFLRTPAIQFFADKADYVIVHDAEHVEHYHLEPTLSSFRYRFDFTLHRPNSVIVSNYLDCERFVFLQPRAASNWIRDQEERRRAARKGGRRKQEAALEARQSIHKPIDATASTEGVFTDIFERNGWQSTTRSGSGSTLEATWLIRQRLSDLFSDLDIGSLCDAPCGDAGWITMIADRLHSYRGFDVVPQLIQENAKIYPQHSFAVADVTKTVLPAADAILCRDCLVHLPLQMGLDAIERFKESGSTYLIATTFPESVTENADRPLGRWRALNLELPPFGFQKPLRLLGEREPGSGGKRSDKSLGVWRIADLPMRRERS